MHGPKSWHQLQAPTNDYHVPPNLCNHCNLKRSGHFFWLPSFALNELPELAFVLSDIHHKTWGAMTGKQEIARKVTGTQPKSTEGPIGLDTVEVPSTQPKKIGSWWIKLVHFRISAIRKNAGFLQDQSTSVVHTFFCNPYSSLHWADICCGAVRWLRISTFQVSWASRLGDTSMLASCAVYSWVGSDWLLIGKRMEKRRKRDR